LEKNRSMLFIAPVEAPTPITSEGFAWRQLSPCGDWLGSSMPAAFRFIRAICLDATMIVDCGCLHQGGR
jgi:hypothetical protein